VSDALPPRSFPITIFFFFFMDTFLIPCSSPYTPTHFSPLLFEPKRFFSSKSEFFSLPPPFLPPPRFTASPLLCDSFQKTVDSVSFVLFRLNNRLMRGLNLILPRLRRSFRIARIGPPVLRFAPFVLTSQRLEKFDNKPPPPPGSRRHPRPPFPFVDLFSTQPTLAVVSLIGTPPDQPILSDSHCPGQFLLVNSFLVLQ